MKNARGVIGTIILALPVFFILMLLPLAIMLGSLGMDIRFTSPKVPYIWALAYY